METNAKAGWNGFEAQGKPFETQGKPALPTSELLEIT
jgi:hypothetical protein